MLSDIERKMLRILVNYRLSYRRTPTIRELEIKTGRTKSGVFILLTALEKQRYIEWTPKYPSLISVIEEWDRDSPISRNVQQKYDPRYSPFNS